MVNGLHNDAVVSWKPAGAPQQHQHHGIVCSSLNPPLHERQALTECSKRPPLLHARACTQDRCSQ
jgi:hypothetical protein